MKTLLLPLLSLLTLVGCKKDEVDALPAATQEGKGTAGCLVDGKAWTPEWRSSNIMGNAFLAGSYRINHHRSLTLMLTRLNSRENTDIHFFLPDIQRPGTFDLDDYADPMLTHSNPPYGEYIDNKQSPYLKCYTSPQATGTLTITRFDTVAQVVAGTFELHPSAVSGQVVHITQGRFDLPLAVQ